MIGGSIGNASSTLLMLIPGLLCDDRLWRYQVDHLADLATPVITDVTGGASVSEMALAVLDAAPERRFALAGLSLGGYIALEIMRAAPKRVERLDTSARTDTPEQTKTRLELIGLARKGRFGEILRMLLPKIVNPERFDDKRLTSTVFAMAEAVGPEVFVH